VDRRTSSSVCESLSLFLTLKTLVVFVRSHSVSPCRILGTAPTARNHLLKQTCFQFYVQDGVPVGSFTVHTRIPLCIPRQGKIFSTKKYFSGRFCFLYLWRSDEQWEEMLRRVSVRCRKIERGSHSFTSADFALVSYKKFLEAFPNGDFDSVPASSTFRGEDSRLC